jgi:hypothetical protein
MQVMLETAADQLRELIWGCGLSIRDLSWQANVNAGMIHRFLGNRSSLTIHTLDRLCKVMNLEIVKVRVRSGRRRSEIMPIADKRRQPRMRKATPTDATPQEQTGTSPCLHDPE